MIQDVEAKKKEPVMVNGFSHGGTNILINLLLSHPDLCYPGETHKALAGGTKSHGTLRRLVKRVSFRIADMRWKVGDLSRVYVLNPRTTFPHKATGWFKSTLEKEKRRANHESHNLWIWPRERYSFAQRKDSRLLLKNNNGLCLQYNLLRSAFPSARVLCFFRHPFALIESHLRKGRDLEMLLNLFSRVWSSLIKQAQAERERYMLIRFENILAKPQESLEQIYAFAKLDIGRVTHIRLQHKAHYTNNGTYKHSGSYDRQVVWYDPADIGEHLDPAANLRAIQRLDDSIKDRVAHVFQSHMEKMGYLRDEPYILRQY